MKRIPLSSYIAWNNPAGAKAVIESFGYQVHNVRGQDDLSQCVNQFVNREGEKGLRALAKVHPDRDLILETEKLMGADGFSEEATVKTPVTIIPEQAQPATTKTQTDYTPIIIASMFFTALFTTAAIFIKK